MKTEWLSTTQYMEKTGLSRKTIDSLIASGQIIASTTDGGGKRLIKHDSPDDNTEILKELIAKVDKLSKHLGLQL